MDVPNPSAWNVEENAFDRLEVPKQDVECFRFNNSQLFRNVTSLSAQGDLQVGLISDRAIATRYHFCWRNDSRMNLVFALAFGVLLVATVESCERRGARCPEYTVLQTHQDYEEREYPPLVWVSVSGNGKSKSDISRKLIKKLYSYLGGANDKGMVLDMMVPVRTKKVIHEGFNTYTMSIPLRPEQSEDPPKPEDASITVIREPRTSYFVRSFEGYARQDSIWDDHAKALNASLPTDGAADTFYFMCVYDSPWQDTDRLNEVWLGKA